MFKRRGSLEKQDLTDLSQVSYVKAERTKYGIYTQQSRVKKPRPRRPFHTVVIAIGALLLVAAVAVSFFTGSIDAGNVNVEELTSVQVTVNINSTPTTYTTNSTTVEQLLNELRIRLDETDYLAADLDTKLYDGMVLWVRLSVDITVIADGQETQVVSQPITVREALTAAGISLGELDQVSAPLLQYIYSDTEIDVYRVTQQQETVAESIEQDTVSQEYTYLTPGSETEVSPGQPGVRTNTYLVTYGNGLEIDRQLLSTEVTTQPQNRVIGIGPSVEAVSANGAVHTATAADGATFYYTRQYEVETTAYTWTGNRTATGTWPKHGTIAVDPDQIALGTKVYIVGYGFATAEDTGGAINGNIVDLYMDSETECLNWGRRDVVIYILAE